VPDDGVRGVCAGQLRPADRGTEKLEVGAAYAVWTGIGAAGAAVIGMIFLGDAASTLKLVSIGLVLAGVIGLSLSGVTP
jgi:quaternary ammonium compound-resistance protein SugE